MPTLGNHFLNSLELVKSYFASAVAGPRSAAVFDDIETFCLFIGYPHSGHSLVGALLDAHPNIVIAHEQGILKHVAAGFGRRQIYHLLLDNSRRYAQAGRVWNGYSYVVPGQWQGRFRQLLVIGDKKGHGTTFWLRQVPSLLDRLRQRVGVKVRLVHVIRNPYDNIATIFTRQQQNDPTATLYARVQLYFSLCDTVSRVKSGLDPADWFEMRHESFVNDPGSHLREIASFLDVGAPEDWVQDCARIVFASPRRTRGSVGWDERSLSLVNSEIERFSYLRGYTFES